MPEGIEETPQTEEPTAEAAPEQNEVEPTSEEGAEPQNLNDALAQMNHAIGQLSERIPEQQQPQEQSPFDFLAGQREDPAEEPGYDGPYQEPYDQPYDQGAAEDPMAQFREVMREEIENTVAPIFQQQEMERREAQIHQLAEQYPALREPEVLNDLDNELNTLARTYGEGVKTDPRFVKMAFLAREAQLATTSQGPEGSEGEPAEAGSQGPHVEHGAGPGAQPEEMDPIERAYIDALTGGGPAGSDGLG